MSQESYRRKPNELVTGDNILARVYQEIERLFKLLVYQSYIFCTFFQASGNKVSKQTVLCGSQNIVLNGKVIIQSDAIIRGDLANVRIGRYCIISKNAVIRPPFKKFSKG